MKTNLSDKDFPDFLLRCLLGEESSEAIKITPEYAAFVETQGWEAWVTTFFGPGTQTNLSAGFAKHHKRYWKWLWSIELGQYTPPFVFLLARGGAKSSSLELGYACMGARLTRRFMLNTSETIEQSQEHLGNIQTFLETPEMQAGYPNLGARLVNQYGSSRGWSQTQLVTKHGAFYMCLSLDKAARGVKKYNWRPDFEGFDDVDSESESPAMTRKKINKITKKILAAGSTDMTGMFAQNVITNTSMAHMFAQGNNPFFTDAHVEGPIPACYNLVTEENPDYEPGVLGSKKWIVVSCEPTWEGQDQQVIESQINKWTLPVFLTESQHEVDTLQEGAILDCWDEVYHVIEQHEFLRIYQEDFVVYDERLDKEVFRVPHHVPKIMGGDEGMTYEHPSVFGWYFSAPELRFGKHQKFHKTLDGWFFRYREYYTPKKANKVGNEQAKVNPLEVGRKIVRLEQDAGETNIKRRIVSRDAKYFRDLFSLELKLQVEYPDSTYTSGIPEMKAYMALRDLPNPFVRYPDGYHDPRTGEDLSGKPLPKSPRFCLIVPDGSATLQIGPTGKLERSGPRGIPGLDEQDRFRWEAPRWHWDETADGMEKKRPFAYEEDAMSECRYVFGAGAAPKKARLKGEQAVVKKVLTEHKDLTNDAINAMVDPDEIAAAKTARMLLLNAEREKQSKAKHILQEPMRRIRRTR